MSKIFNRFGKELRLLKVKCDFSFVSERQYSANMRYVFVCIMENYENILQGTQSRLKFYRR